MSACVIMHNMIIESERKNPPNDHGTYEYVGPLAHVDHQVPAEFPIFLQCMEKFEIEICIFNCKLISSSICGTSEGSHHLSPSLSLILLFKLFEFVLYCRGWKTILLSKTLKP